MWDVMPKPTTGVFLAWPPTPPVPPLAHSPPAHAVDPRPQAEFLQVKRNLSAPQYSDCELIVLLDTQQRRTKTIAHTTIATGSTKAYSQTATISKMDHTQRYAPMMPSSDMNASRDLNVLTTPTLSPLMTENMPYEAECPQNGPTNWFDDYPLTPPFPHDVLTPYQNQQPSPVDQMLNIDELFGDVDFDQLDRFIHMDGPSPVAACIDMPVANPYSQSQEVQPSTSQQHHQLDVDPVDEFFPQLSHENKMPSSSRSSPSAESVSSGGDHSEYRVRRDKNNIASARSRAKRQQKVRDTKDEKEKLEKRNVELRTLLDSLQAQVDDYKSMVLMVVGNKSQ